jgi:hypothetical protein
MSYWQLLGTFGQGHWHDMTLPEYVEPFYLKGKYMQSIQIFQRVLLFGLALCISSGARADIKSNWQELVGRFLAKSHESSRTITMGKCSLTVKSDSIYFSYSDEKNENPFRRALGSKMKLESHMNTVKKKFVDGHEVWTIKKAWKVPWEINIIFSSSHFTWWNEEVLYLKMLPNSADIAAMEFGELLRLGFFAHFFGSYTRPIDVTCTPQIQSLRKEYPTLRQLVH